ncbi:MAG TPA: adenylate/guanylate cyclase domain-containing protein [Spirochaetota bacterium]|mgnify:CR=1 FL=1|nr:adenylate/guanylate cyclase domain-containing protein [Spirochaetota bacterium]HOS41260.1 adenylate/guanylate cyclase domain-containing protein [Spirochaetota bacterium]
MDNLKKILVIDDSDLVAGMLSSLLEKSGYATSRAVNGLEGVIAVYREAPDLVIMDVEMPVLQGYQASRLLKARRGVCDIPIIMHTSLSGDRDEFWALSSGADAFITKDFDNLMPLLDSIGELIGARAVNRSIIAEDAAKVDRDCVMEMLSTTLDGHLFQSVILNRLSETAACIGSLSDTGVSVLSLIDRVCSGDIAVLLLKSEGEVAAFIRPGPGMDEAAALDFYRICVDDFYGAFPDAPRTDVAPVFAEQPRPSAAFDAPDERVAIRSYAHWVIPGRCAPVGTLHVGSRVNNYFTAPISANVNVFADGAGSIIENAMLLKNITTMERNIRNVFSKFVPAEIIDDLAGKSRSQGLRAGEKRNVAILFTDIRSFTEITEKNRPEDVVALLNRYFSTMAEAVIRHGGTIDKYIGDAILAVFGAPRAYSNNAERAVSAAFDMLRSLQNIDTAGLIMPDGRLDMGIGIHEGDVIVGNIGSKERFDYTVIGDAVNLASRLEGLTKMYRSHVIVSESVRAALKDAMTFRELDRVRVKGKGIPTTIFKLENVTRMRFSEEQLRDYAKAVSMYKIKNWDTAIEYFNKVLEHNPDDYVSAMFVSRCEEYRRNPPPDDWDGAISFDGK